LAQVNESSARLKENKALAWRAWMAYDAHDFAAFAACVTPDWVEHHFERESRLEDLPEMMAQGKVAFPDWRTELLLELAEDDLVAMLTLTTGTHAAPYRGLEPTGRIFRMYQINIFRIVAGRISESWVMVGDKGGPFQQLSEPAAS